MAEAILDRPERCRTLLPRLIGFVMLLGIFGACEVFAAPGPYQCYRDFLPNTIDVVHQGGGAMHVNGFAIEVKPGMDPEFPPQTDCNATIRSPDGAVIFEAHDDGFDIDSITGKDVDGDGLPDAVLVGYSGGAHCCTTFHIVSLGGRPGSIKTLQNDASFEDLKGDGRIEIVVHDAAYDYFYGDSAESPIPDMILLLEGNKFKDVSSQFLTRYDADIAKWRSRLANLNLKGFRLNNVRMSALESHTIQCGLFSIVLDYLYSGRLKDARKSLDELWPTDWPLPDFVRPIPADEIWNAMLKIYCGELSADLNRESSLVCSSR